MSPRRQGSAAGAQRRPTSAERSVRRAVANQDEADLAVARAVAASEAQAFTELASSASPQQLALLASRLSRAANRLHEAAHWFQSTHKQSR